MRLDKFLQASRLIKRRALANRYCDAGRVLVNGRAGKPAAAVRPGDVVDVNFGGRRLVVRVLRLPEGRPSAEPVYEVAEDRRVAEGW